MCQVAEVVKKRGKNGIETEEWAMREFTDKMREKAV